MPLIQLNHLQKTYGEEGTQTLALKEVSFSVEPGEFVAIMGPSGSGKSTLLHILGFLERQSAGEYYFEGKKNTNFADHELAKLRNQKVGFIFQAFNLLARTTVYDNVLLPMLYSATPESEWDTRVRQAIEAVGLTQRLSHESSQLSGGERQRVAIARAMINQPTILFADEPTGNLDSVSGQAVMKLLQNLNKLKGHTILLITHDAHIASHAKRVIRVRDGQIESDQKLT